MMKRKILLATDGSEHSAKAITETINLTSSLKAEVTVITVLDEMPSISYFVPASVINEIRKRYEENSKKILEAAEQRFREHGIAVKTKLASGHPADEISSEANMGNYDLVVMGSRGLGGITELFLGSVSNKVVNSVKPSIFIVK
jgi:nucleotide-binding universal stress UspA family protein